MAQRLTPARHLAWLALVAALSAYAQDLQDPTRPPSAPVPGAAAGAATPQDSAGAQLQSVLISPARRLAVIDGQTVALGGSFGEARLVSISESGVVLKRGDALETLRLLPGLEKKSPAAAAGRAKKGKGER
jgi:MSHA biogenesis protein MshK